MTVLFPGSFDPFTLGHEDIVRRALKLFSKVVIAVGYNIDKKYMLTSESRAQLIKDLFKDEKRVEVIIYDGLTVDICREKGITSILRGVRSIRDFEYETSIDIINRTLYPEIETIILLTDPEYAPISSSVVREIVFHGGCVKKFMPEGISLEDYL